MMFISPDMTREQLLEAISSEPELHYKFYYTDNFMGERADNMTAQELYEYIGAWIEEGDECSAA